MPKYFDIHSHLTFSDYESDREEVIGRLKETGTHTITVGTDFESSKKALELAKKYKEIYACVGIHPISKYDKGDEASLLPELFGDSRVVAVGECGLDFFHADKNSDYQRQRNLFLAQIDLALKYDKPIMIHARNAYSELLEILEPLKQNYGDKLRGNVHFFTGDENTAKRFTDIGFSLSFTGVITFSRDYDSVLRSIPIDMIMSETDAPYVTPAPYRGKRNEPSYVKEVVAKIAEVRGENLKVVEVTLVNNALSMLG